MDTKLKMTSRSHVKWLLGMLLAACALLCCSFAVVPALANEGQPSPNVFKAYEGTVTTENLEGCDAIEVSGDVTFDNVKFEARSGSAVTVSKDATITVKGSCALTGAEGGAGIYVPENVTVKIVGADDAAELVVTGNGGKKSLEAYGAGIGACSGAEKAAIGAIEIDKLSRLEAHGFGWSVAGIGTGYETEHADAKDAAQAKDALPTNSSVKITNSTVKAAGGLGGAAIGGAYQSKPVVVVVEKCHVDVVPGVVDDEAKARLVEMKILDKPADNADAKAARKFVDAAGIGAGAHYADGKPEGFAVVLDEKSKVREFTDALLWDDKDVKDAEKNTKKIVGGAALLGVDASQTVTGEGKKAASAITAAAAVLKAMDLQIEDDSAADAEAKEISVDDTPSSGATKSDLSAQSTSTASSNADDTPLNVGDDEEDADEDADEEDEDEEDVTDTADNSQAMNAGIVFMLSLMAFGVAAAAYTNVRREEKLPPLEQE